MYPRLLNSGLDNVFMMLKQRLNMSGEHGSPCKTPRLTISWLVHSFFTTTKIDDPWYILLKMSVHILGRW